MFEQLSPLLPGPDGKPREMQPFYATREEYEEFRERFVAAVTPQLEKYRLAHLRSERESMFRIVR